MHHTFLAWHYEQRPNYMNAIAMNAHEDSPYRAPSQEAMNRFTAAAHTAGIRVTLRRSRGEDTDAACGTLAARAYQKDATPPPPDSSSKGV